MRALQLACATAGGPALAGTSCCLPPPLPSRPLCHSSFAPAAAPLQPWRLLAPQIGSTASKTNSSSSRASSRRRASVVPRATLLGAAAKAAALLPAAAASIHSAIDPGVLAATVNASGKLFIICATVGWLLRTQRIPNSTATVLSQVSFQLMIPCMLFSKVASTLAAQPDATLLLGIAAAALLQIFIGAMCGLVLTPMLGLQQQEQQRTSSVGGGGGGAGASWEGRSSPAAASAIALSMAAASGAPLAAAALRPKPRPPSAALGQLVGAAAAFGNSFTLPAVFLTTLLPPAVANRALGYAALFLLAWSPCLWSLGTMLVSGQPQQQQSGGWAGSSQAAAATAAQQAAAEQQEGEQQQGGEGVRRKPLAWRQPKVVDVTPEDSSSRSSNRSLSTSSSSSSSSIISSREEAELPAPPTWAEHLARHPATAWLCQFASQVLNPPVMAILAGMVVGLSPTGRALLATTQAGSAAAAAAGVAAAALPPELGMLHAVARAALEVIELLAAGTLATQTLVLAASLLQQPEGPGAAAPVVGPAAAATASAATSLHRRGWLGAAKQQLLPSNAAEGRALAVLSLTRFLLVPLATVACLQGLVAGGLLPPVMADPVLLFVLLVEACMPSAQNLIIVLQLSERTRGLAPGFARMLLKLYCYSIIPVTLWVTAFATNLGIAVLR